MKTTEAGMGSKFHKQSNKIGNFGKNNPDIEENVIQVI